MTELHLAVIDELKFSYAPTTVLVDMLCSTSYSNKNLAFSNRMLIPI